MTFTKYKVGDFIKSHYRARYKGVVLEVIPRAGYNDLIKILIVKCSNGSIPIRKNIQSLDAWWVAPIEPFDISYINKDWYDIH